MIYSNLFFILSFLYCIFLFMIKIILIGKYFYYTLLYKIGGNNIKNTLHILIVIKEDEKLLDKYYKYFHV